MRVPHKAICKNVSCSITILVMLHSPNFSLAALLVVASATMPFINPQKYGLEEREVAFPSA